MPRARPYAVLDVFTDEPLTGNGLAVVAEADGVDEATMLAFARETRLSETTFLQTHAGDDADYRLRIWTPVTELPFAGHPSLGSAVAVARWAGAERAQYRQRTPAGVQPVDVELLDERRAHASMLQSDLVLGRTVPAGPLLAAVGLEPADAHPDLEPQVSSTGLETLVVPVRDAGAVARARPDYAALERVMGVERPPNTYVIGLGPEGGEARARCFMSAEEGEDPATGSAAGACIGYLHEHLGLAALTIVQGVEMRRPSRLETAIEGGRARVGGMVVGVVDGTVTLESS